MDSIKKSLKNLITALVICIVALSVSEISLAIKYRVSEESNNVCEENSNVFIMQLESTSLEKFFTSGTNTVNARSYETLEFDPTFSYCYPLIDMAAETIIDDAFNIVVIGDSFVWGIYSTNRNELFWRLLENDFRKDGVRVNVFGVGTTGANAYEELSWLTDYSLIEDLEPDLVVFGYVYNDSEYADEIQSTTVNWEEALPVLSKFERIFPNLYSKLTERISVKTMYTDKYADNDYVNYTCAPPILKGKFYERYRTEFVEKLDEFAASVDFPIAVVTLPTLPNNIMLEELYKPLESLYANCENIYYYNSVESYNKFASYKHKKNYSVNIADFHPGSATNRFYADYLKSFIEDDFSASLKNFMGKFEEKDEFIINEYLPYDISLQKISNNDNAIKYKLKYPDTSVPHNVYGIKISPYCLIEPLGKEHIKLSFSNSVNLSELEFKGDYDSLDVYYTSINEKLNYDDHKIYEFEKHSNNKFCSNPNSDITSIIISAEFSKEANRDIEITFKRSEDNP